MPSVDRRPEAEHHQAAFKHRTWQLDLTLSLLTFRLPSADAASG